MVGIVELPGPASGIQVPHPQVLALNSGQGCGGGEGRGFHQETGDPTGRGGGDRYRPGGETWHLYLGSPLAPSVGGDPYQGHHAVPEVDGPDAGVSEIITAHHPDRGAWGPTGGNDLEAGGWHSEAGRLAKGGKGAVGSSYSVRPYGGLGRGPGSGGGVAPGGG